MAISIGESCGFYPGMLVVTMFAPVLFALPYIRAAAVAMILIGGIGGKRGLYFNLAINLLGIAAFVLLAIASAFGYVPWPSKCTIDF